MFNAEEVFYYQYVEGNVGELQVQVNKSYQEKGTIMSTEKTVIAKVIIIQQVQNSYYLFTYIDTTQADNIHAFNCI